MCRSTSGITAVTIMFWVGQCTGTEASTVMTLVYKYCVLGACTSFIPRPVAGMGMRPVENVCVGWLAHSKIHCPSKEIHSCVMEQT